MRKGVFQTFITVAFLLICVILPARSEGTVAIGKSSDILQFKAGNHIIGFSPGKAYLVALDHALTVEFLGAKGVMPKAEGGEPAGNSSSEAQSLKKVVYQDLWEGITLAYESTKDGLTESTYHVAAGADLSKIRLKYNVPVETQGDGSLKFRFDGGFLTESAPIAWQEVDGKRATVKVVFKVADGLVGFEAGAYDKTRPLVIDPTYQWHTFFGPNTSAHSIAVDAAGNIYAYGNSSSAWNGPTGQAPLHGFTAGRTNSYVLKLNPSGAYQWHTFFCGVSTGATLDKIGNIYIAAYTSYPWNYLDPNSHSIILPLHPFAPSPSAVTWVCWCYFEFPSGNYVCKTCSAYPPNAQILKLNSEGAYQWHTFFGSGTSASASGEMLPGDFSFKLATDSGNNVYLSGRSSGAWYGPEECRTAGVPPCPLNTFSPGHVNLFALKLNSSGAYQWHTFYKFFVANQNTAPIAVDPDGNSYIVTSANEAWTGPSGVSPKHPYHSGALSQAVVLKLDSSGIYQWHTFYGDDFANGYAIAADIGSNVYIAGDGYAFKGPENQEPVDKGCQNSADATDNLWIMKLNSIGTYLWHTCYYSGQTVGGIAVDGGGSSYVTGSSFMGLGSPFDYDAVYEPSTPDGDCDGSAFVLKINPGGSHLWHAYFGGSLDHYAKAVLTADIGRDVALDADGNVHVAGDTYPPWNGPTGEAPLHSYSTPWIPSMGVVDVANSDMFVLKMAQSAGCRYFNSSEDSQVGFFGTGAGSGSFQVEALSDTSPAACSWTAVSSDASWLDVTSGGSGAGNGTVAYAVDANGDPHDRSGTITVGGQYAFPVYQEGTGTAAATVPTVTTVAAASAITDTSASGGGDVTSDGGAIVMWRGVCWSEQADPTTDDTCTDNGSGLGAFSSVMEDLTPNSTYHFRAYATNMKGDGYGGDLQFTTTAPNLYRLTVQAGGNGYGTVSSSAGGVGFSYPTLSSANANITRGSEITLTAVAASGSTVAWYGNCDSTGGSSTTATCTITAMNAAKTVQAAFVTPCAIGPVRKDPLSYYDSIGIGYSAIADNSTLQMQGANFTENLTLNRSVDVTMKGGYDCAFSANTGWTTVSGNMTVSDGSVAIENLIIK
jgi:hypothetical protein